MWVEEIVLIGLVMTEDSRIRYQYRSVITHFTFHLVRGHSLDVSEGLLRGSDELGPPLPHPPLVLVLLIEPLIVAELPLADAVYRGADTTSRHLNKISLVSRIQYEGKHRKSLRGS